LEEIIQAGKRSIKEEPFYGVFLSGLNKNLTTNKTPTVCVGVRGINVELFINEVQIMKTFMNLIEKVS